MAETRRTSERRKASVSTGASAGKDWDGTINDLSTMKFNDEELKARRESFSSKNAGKGRSKFYDDILRELSPAIKQSPQASPMGRNLLDVTSPFNLDKENGHSINSRRASDVVVPDVNHAPSFRTSMTSDNGFDSKISFAVISSDEQIAHIRSMCAGLLPLDDKRPRLDESRDGRRTILVEIVDDFAKISQRHDLEIRDLQKQKESLLSDFISSKEQSVRLTKDCSQLRMEFASLRFEFEKYRADTESLISLLNKQVSRLSTREADPTAFPTAAKTQEDWKSTTVASPRSRQSNGATFVNTASFAVKIVLLVSLFALIFVALGALGFLFVDSIPYKFDDLVFDLEY